jgi:PEP-CTERM motif-containing protein
LLAELPHVFLRKRFLPGKAISTRILFALLGRHEEPVMKRFLLVLLVSTVLYALTPSARADFTPTLSISPESADLTNLTVGQTVRFDVAVSGLNPGDALDYLAGTVLYDSTLLAPASAVTAGSIIPDPSGFAGDTVGGTGADAFYDAVNFSISNTPITQNGTFFTFDVTTRQPGSGSISFDLSSLAANDGNNNPITLEAAGPVSFVINASSGNPNPVPEPPSWILLLIGAGTFIFARKARQKLRMGTA